MYGTQRDEHDGQGQATGHGVDGIRRNDPSIDLGLTEMRREAQWHRRPRAAPTHHRLKLLQPNPERFETAAALDASAGRQGRVKWCR